MKSSLFGSYSISVSDEGDATMVIIRKNRSVISFILMTFFGGMGVASAIRLFTHEDSSFNLFNWLIFLFFVAVFVFLYRDLMMAGTIRLKHQEADVKFKYSKRRKLVAPFFVVEERLNRVANGIAYSVIICYYLYVCDSNGARIVIMHNCPSEDDYVSPRVELCKLAIQFNKAMGLDSSIRDVYKTKAAQERRTTINKSLG